MVRQATFFLSLLISAISWAATSPIARVNGEAIGEEDYQLVTSAPGATATASAEERLNRLILFRLAVQEARRSGLEADPEVKQAVDKALYRRFLEKTLEASKTSTEPTEAQLRAAYEALPMVRLRHLALFAGTPKEARIAEKKLATIRTALKKGQDFKTVVLKHSQDAGARFAGDLDYRGVENLPEPIYQAALKLKPGEVSEPIHLDGALHLIQMMDRMPFASAPATYRSLLGNRLRRDAENRALETRLAALKKDAKVEILSGNGTGENP